MPDNRIALAEELEALLSDPVAVHVNMLAGKIAKPSIESIIHLYGADALRAALRADHDAGGAVAMREAAARLIESRADEHGADAQEAKARGNGQYALREAEIAAMVRILAASIRALPLASQEGSGC